MEKQIALWFQNRYFPSIWTCFMHTMNSTLSNLFCCWTVEVGFCAWIHSLGYSFVIEVFPFNYLWSFCIISPFVSCSWRTSIYLSVSTKNDFNVWFISKIVSCSGNKNNFFPINKSLNRTFSSNKMVFLFRNNDIIVTGWYLLNCLVGWLVTCFVAWLVSCWVCWLVTILVG